MSQRRHACRKRCQGTIICAHEILKIPLGCGSVLSTSSCVNQVCEHDSSSVCEAGSHREMLSLLFQNHGVEIVGQSLNEASCECCSKRLFGTCSWCIGEANCKAEWNIFVHMAIREYGSNTFVPFVVPCRLACHIVDLHVLGACDSAKQRDMISWRSALSMQTGELAALA